jgi:hypothetical protein
MAFILIVFGLIFLWAGVNGWRESREHYDNAQKTVATVVGHRDTYTEPGEGKVVKAYVAIYAYQDNDGNEHRMEGRRKSTRKSSLKIGTQKYVYFNPDNPTEVKDMQVTVFSSLIFAFIAGAGMVGFGVAALLLDWDL